MILHGLVGEMAMGKAREMPASNVSFITLFAAPVSGSSVAAVLSHTLGKLFGPLRFLFGRQVRQVARGPAMDDLLTKVVDGIYAPAKEDGSHRAIPIRMVMASRDQIVDATDRQRDRARFTRCAPLAYDYDHSTIKEPANHDDKRYMALARDVQAGLAQRFQQICREILCGTRDAQESAVVEFARRYEHIFRRRLEEHGVDVHTEQELYRSYLHLIVRECARTPRPPFYAADRALVYLLTSGLVDA